LGVGGWGLGVGAESPKVFIF